MPGWAEPGLGSLLDKEMAVITTSKGTTCLALSGEGFWEEVRLSSLTVMGKRQEPHHDL